MPVKKLPKLEALYQKPMPEILADLYDELGDDRLVAHRLDVSMKCLWEWRKKLGCETVVRLRCKDCAEEARTA